MMRSNLGRVYEENCCYPNCKYLFVWFSGHKKELCYWPFIVELMNRKCRGVWEQELGVERASMLRVPTVEWSFIIAFMLLNVFRKKMEIFHSFMQNNCEICFIMIHACMHNDNAFSILSSCVQQSVSLIKSD